MAEAERAANAGGIRGVSAPPPTWRGAARVRPGPFARPGKRRRGRLRRHELGALARLAGPIVISQLGTVGMNTMNTVMVGPLGAHALAAIGLGGSIHMFAMIVAMGTLIGMQPLVSQAFGAGDRLECRRVLVQGLWLAVALAVPVGAVSVWGEAIARGLGQEPALAREAGAYLWALGPGILPFLLFMACRQFLEGMGITRAVMLITLAGLGVNFVANRAFIYGVEGWVPPLGAVGSGWATTAVRWAMFAAVLGYFRWHPALHPLRGVQRRPERARFRRVISIGLPTGAQLGMEVGFFSACAVMMGWFGTTELGTHQVTINLAATTFMVALGVSLAGSVRVGQWVGAGDAAGTRRAAAATYALALGAMGVFALLFLAVPGVLIGLYTRDPQIAALGVTLLGFAAAFQLFDGGQVAGVCVLRGAADTRVPTLITGVAYGVVGLPAAYWLGFHTPLGPSGVWAGMVAALGVAALLLALRVRRVLWGRTTVRAG